MSVSKKNLVFLVSGGGTNMQAVLDKIEDGTINAQCVAVISSNDKAYAIERAKSKNIPVYICALSDFDSSVERDKQIEKLLKKHNADYIILAGYLGVLSPFIIDEFPEKIINIHPALLPSYGGKSFYGINVHRAVIAAKEPFSGATAHFVDKGIDTGRIIAQEKIAVDPADTPESLQKKIIENVEHKLLVRVVKDLCEYN